MGALESSPLLMLRIAPSFSFFPEIASILYPEHDKVYSHPYEDDGDCHTNDFLDAGNRVKPVGNPGYTEGYKHAEY